MQRNTLIMPGDRRILQKKNALASLFGEWTPNKCRDREIHHCVLHKFNAKPLTFIFTLVPQEDGAGGGVDVASPRRGEQTKDTPNYFRKSV